MMTTINLCQRATAVTLLLSYWLCFEPCPVGAQTVDPDYLPIPTQSYANIDINASKPDGLDVEMFTLGDDNNAAFGYYDQGRNTFYVKKWSQGQSTDGPTITTAVDGIMTLPWPDDPDGFPVYKFLSPVSLTSDGTVSGNTTYLGVSASVGIQDEPFMCSKTPEAGQVLSASPVSAPEDIGGPFFDLTYLDDPAFTGRDVDMFSSDGKIGASNLYISLPQTDPPLNPSFSHYFGSTSYVGQAIFDPGDYSPNKVVQTNWFKDQFHVSCINIHGWATGRGDGSTYFLWNNPSAPKDPAKPDLVPLDAPGWLNDSNDVLVCDTTLDPADNSKTYLLEKGDATKKKHFLADGTDVGLIPGRFQTEIRNVCPGLMSNRTAAATDDDPDRTMLNILVDAEVRRSASNDTWEATTLLLQMYSDGTCDLLEPVGVDNFGLWSINSSGVIAAIGNGGHALLLVPSKFDAVAGQINFGFDPPMKGLPSNDPPIPDDPPGEYWASAIKGEPNHNVRFVLPQSIAASTRLHISGEDADHPNQHLNLSPKDSPLSSTETILTLSGLSTLGGNAVPDGDDPVTERIDALVTDGLSSVTGGKILSSLNVAILPKRSVSVGIYRISDSLSPQTSIAGAPIDDDIITTLNDVFSQAGVSFVKADAASGTGVHYDTDLNGKFGGKDDDDAIREFLAQRGTVVPKVDFILMEESGIPYPSDPNKFVRGTLFKLDNFHEGRIIFVKTTNEAGGDVKIVVAHEMGHILGLTTRNPTAVSGNDDHDPGPFPPTTDGLMKSGQPDPNTGILPKEPGLWLPHEDWTAANTGAKNL